MITCWQRDNNSNNWSRGLQFVQHAKNARHHTGIGRSPFMAQMGYEAKLRVQTLNFDKDILDGVDTEEQLNNILNIQEDDDTTEISNEERNLNDSFNNNDLNNAEFVIENQPDNCVANSEVLESVSVV